jgi:hypothetical protein
MTSHAWQRLRRVMMGIFIVGVAADAGLVVYGLRPAPALVAAASQEGGEQVASRWSKWQQRWAGARLRGRAHLRGTPTPSPTVLAASSKRRVRPTATPKPVPSATPIATPVAGPAAGGNGYIGVFATTSPSDPGYKAQIDKMASLGFNLMYNYIAFDGSAAEVKGYLDYAQSKGMKVIVSLHALYDQMPEASENLRIYSQYGSTNEAIALGVVKAFESHPAVWGFSLTDERPESASSAAQWKPILATRYTKIKALTAKPVMAILVGWSDPGASNRKVVLDATAPASDVLALDYYPIPYMSTSYIDTMIKEAMAYGSTWFIEQVFSWASYPDTAESIGFDVSKARTPTTDEMLAMAKSARAAGASNLLMYSYFDIAGDSAQLERVKQVVAALKQ